MSEFLVGWRVAPFDHDHCSGIIVEVVGESRYRVLWDDADLPEKDPSPGTYLVRATTAFDEGAEAAWTESDGWVPGVGSAYLQALRPMDPSSPNYDYDRGMCHTISRRFQIPNIYT